VLPVLRITLQSGQQAMSALLAPSFPQTKSMMLAAQKGTYAEGCDGVLEKSAIGESDDTAVSHLSIIQDENLPFEENVISLTSAISGNSPVDTLNAWLHCVPRRVGSPRDLALSLLLSGLRLSTMSIRSERHPPANHHSRVMRTNISQSTAYGPSSCV
jgi:hypothetical protein